MKIRLSHMVCYLIALTLSLWCFGKDIPGIKIGLFMGGIIVFFYLSPVLFLRKTLQIPHKLLFVSFVALHLVVINPFKSNPFALSFSFKILTAFIFLFLLVNLVDNFELYSKMMLVHLFAVTVLVAVFVYLHLVVFHSTFLTVNLTKSGLFYGGRGGKNTLSFILALLFPFYYARFSHKKNIFNLLIVLLMGFSVLYTLSRMALISMVLSLLLFPLLAIRRTMYIKQFVVVATLVMMISLSFGIGLKTFMALKDPTNAESIERGQGEFVGAEGHRMRLARAGVSGFLTSPLFGHGVASFRQQEATGESLSHNDYLQILYELGLSGILLFLGIIIVSLRDLMECRKNIPEEHQWLWDGQIVCLLSLCVTLLFINVYETMPFWFVLAGCHILVKVSQKKENYES